MPPWRMQGPPTCATSPWPSHCTPRHSCLPAEAHAPVTPTSRILAWLPSDRVAVVPACRAWRVAAAADSTPPPSSSPSEASVFQGDDTWERGVDAPDTPSLACRQLAS